MPSVTEESKDDSPRRRTDDFECKCPMYLRIIQTTVCCLLEAEDRQLHREVSRRYLQCGIYVLFWYLRCHFRKYNNIVSVQRLQVLLCADGGPRVLAGNPTTPPPPKPIFSMLHITHPTIYILSYRLTRAPNGHHWRCHSPRQPLNTPLEIRGIVAVPFDGKAVVIGMLGANNPKAIRDRHFGISAGFQDFLLK